MNLSLRTAGLTAALLATLATGCGSAMFPQGLVATAGPWQPVGAGPSAGASGAAAGINNCITPTACNWNSDCPDGGHCNTTMHRCFDPDPVASTVLTCNQNDCTWDSECPAAWSCNTATHHCQLR